MEKRRKEGIGEVWDSCGWIGCWIGFKKGGGERFNSVVGCFIMVSGS